MALLSGHRANFETLQRAFAKGNAALMECKLAATGEAVAVVCAVNRQDNGDFQFVPFAMFFNGNPYQVVNPPNPDGGFCEQE